MSASRGRSERRLAGVSSVEAEKREIELRPIERFRFYDFAKAAYAIIATGETAVYANLILKKGVVAPEQ